MQLDHEQFAAGGHAHSSECILKLLGSSVDEERATEVSLNPLRWLLSPGSQIFFLIL